MKSTCLSVIVAAMVALCGAAHADQKPEDILKAIVKVKAVIPENARTASLLGTEREGSGVVIDSKGLVLTIGYLILEAETVEVVGPNGEAVGATAVGYDYGTGFGLLRATAPLEVTPMKLGQSSEVSEKDRLLVATHGGPESVIGVYVVSRREFAGYWEYLLEDAIFTSPPHPGFGGSALIGPDGRLLGIGSLYTQITLPEVGVVPSNLFVPIDHLKPILDDMLRLGHSSEPTSPWLGLHAREAHGRVFVLRVIPGGPADQAGLRPDDIILKVDEKVVKGLADLYRKVWALGRAGVDVPLTVLQEAELRNITVHSGDRYQYLRLVPKR
jgi:S1-C subfamily serine protease